MCKQTRTLDTYQSSIMVGKSYNLYQKRTKIRSTYIFSIDLVKVV